MSIITLSSREFNHDIAKAKRAACDGPVIITDRGKPAHVLLSIEEYQRLSGKPRNIAHALAMPEHEDFDFEAPQANIRAKPADLI